MQLTNQKYLLNDNKLVTLESMVGDNGMVLFCYPKAFTPGCTLEVKEYNDNYNKIADYGYSVIGFSLDQQDKQDKFACDYELNYKLICDIDKTLSTELDVLKENKESIVRSTFIVNKNLEVIKEFRSVKPVEHIQDILNELRNITESNFKK